MFSAIGLAATWCWCCPRPPGWLWSRRRRRRRWRPTIGSASTRIN